MLSTPLPRARRTMLVVPALLVASLTGIGHANPTYTETCYTVNSSIAIVTGDFNGDGKTDIAMNPSPPPGCGPPFFCIGLPIDIYLGNGDGTFTGPTQADMGKAFIQMTSGDLNGDGKIDLIGDLDPLSVIFGNGDGTFQAPQFYAGAGSGVAIGDLNGDGKPDVVAGASGGKREVMVWLNQGNGTLVPGTSQKLNDQPRSSALADLNNDGILDLIELTTGHAGVSTFLGKGDGKFRQRIDTTVPFFPGRSIAVPDLDGDGKRDLVVSLQADFGNGNQPSEFGKGLVTLRGNGNGTFQAPVQYPLAATGITNNLDVGDLNGDGSPDIAAGNYNAGSFTILYNNGAGAFPTTETRANSLGLGVNIDRIDGDARNDIVVDGCVYLNNGPPVANAIARAEGTPILTSPSRTTLAPNPLHNRGTLTFALDKGGLISAHLYDERGRRVGTLAESIWMPAGNHSLPIDRAKSGLTRGVYFYRIASDGAVRSGRFVVTDE